MYDRDALALAVTAANARANGVAVEIHGGLGSSLDSTGGDAHDAGNRDLVLCNLPAKAGAPVRAGLIRDCASMLAIGGTLALVVVSALTDETADTLSALGGELWQRSAGQHSVLHYTATEAVERPSDRLSSYQRGQATLTLAGRQVPIRSVFGLPDFDTSSHLNQLFASLLARDRGAGSRQRRMWLWNPGQGDLAVWLTGNQHEHASREELAVELASRDALQLHATEANLRASRLPPSASVHAPTPIRSLGVSATLAKPVPNVGLMVVPVAADVAHAEAHQLLPALAGRLAPSGQLLVGGKTGVITALLHRRRSVPGLSLRMQTRRKGQAAALLVRG